MSDDILDAVMVADDAALRGMVIEQAAEIDRLKGRIVHLEADIACGMAERESLQRDRDKALADRDVCDRAMTSVRRAIPCRASRGDGECNWKHCPQEHDGRSNHQNVCPLYVEPEEY